MSFRFCCILILITVISLPLYSNPIMGEINKHTIPGEVTVFISESSVSTIGFKEKTFSTGFVLTEKIVQSMGQSNSIIKSKIENKNGDIRPSYTDSIIVNGVTAYPSPGGNNWLFPYFQGRVTIYACHPDIRALVHFRDTDGDFKKLPKRLLVTSDTVSDFGLLSVESSWIADSLSRFPLLFCMYKYDHIAAIRQFNELEEGKLLPVELAMEITPQIQSIFTAKIKALTVESIQKVLDKAPTEIILNCKMAELKLLHNDDLEGASEHLKIARRSSNSNEYLVYYVDGLILERTNHFDEALNSYYRALQYSADYGGDEMDKFRKMLNKKIGKVQKKV